MSVNLIASLVDSAQMTSLDEWLRAELLQAADALQRAALTHAVGRNEVAALRAALQLIASGAQTVDEARAIAQAGLAAAAPVLGSAASCRLADAGTIVTLGPGGEQRHSDALLLVCASAGGVQRALASRCCTFRVTIGQTAMAPTASTEVGGGG